MSVTATITVEYYNGAAWTDITNDVRAGLGASLKYGMADGTPLSRVASSGENKLFMDNSAFNSQGKQGLYSPNHANVRTGWQINALLRFSITYASVNSGNPYRKFYGRLKDILPIPGLHGQQYVAVIATDYMDELARASLTGLPTQINKRFDQLTTTLLAAMPTQPAATSFDTCKSTFPYAFTVDADGAINGLSELQRGATSEMGYCYVKGNGTTGGVLFIENRHRRPANTTNVLTFNDTMRGLEVPSSINDILNNVQVTAHPRRVDTGNVVLYSSSTVFSLGPQQSITVTGPYRDPNQQAARVGGTSMVAPAATTDYTANSAADGSGSDLTANLTVSATFGANAVTLVITNTSTTASCFVTKMQTRGLGLYDYDQILMISEDPTSEGIYGVNVLKYDMPYEASPLNAGLAGDWIRSLWGNPFATARKISFLANDSDAFMSAAIAQEIGDRIGIIETITGVSTTIPGETILRGFFINAIELSISEGPLIQVIWTLSPADIQPYWILEDANQSLLDQTTRLGFL